MPLDSTEWSRVFDLYAQADRASERYLVELRRLTAVEPWDSTERVVTVADQARLRQLREQRDRLLREADDRAYWLCGGARTG